MNEETNKLLEAILLVLQDNGQDIRTMKDDIRTLNVRMQENTHEITLLRATLERHDAENR